MTHYEVLGVSRSAPGDEIRRAYLALARRHHPDLAEDPSRRAEAERRMREINAAWSVLGDRDQRARYDRSLGPVGAVPRREWQPVDGDDADEADDFDPDRAPGVDGRVDPELLDDSALGDPGLPRGVQVVPPLLVLGGVAAVLVGSVTAIPGLLGLGLVALVAGATLFLLAPLLAVHRSRGGERSGSMGDDTGG